ncbi:MAG TPA: phosphatase PAP2 family protein [Dinghuibacter sp.]|jgi:undecaprenyl-diphosphatase|uniref:phosphatase PAP2 family protein n=1 Tax=Dinghuibacter sp. TaxID=2024697 RepID=UPI002C398EAC|nr:phosphatase PAP2 family protein [Dinghuibacter sp.]HTJ13770.1 phosphatase PAP2 family protein [Dinghuibacter sp.]
MDLLQQIIHGDRILFESINSRWTNPFFDHFFLFVREALFWTPLYFFLLLFVVLNFGWRGWWWACFFIGCVAVTDTVSSHILKEAVGRIRPCALGGSVRFLANYCPQGGSFPSAHATNHFGMATFMALTLGRISRGWWAAWAWAAMISYAQVYVGVHFPLDVLGGAVLGILAGMVFARLYNRKIGPLLFTNPSPE